MQADGSFTYIPDGNYGGTDSFTYKVNDARLDSNITNVVLTVAAPLGTIRGVFWNDLNGDGTRLGRPGPGRPDRLPRREQQWHARRGRGHGRHRRRRLVHAFRRAAGDVRRPGGPPGRLAADFARGLGRAYQVTVGGTLQNVFNFNEFASTADQTIAAYHKAGFTISTR